MAPKRTLDAAAMQRQEKRPASGGNHSMGSSQSSDEGSETTCDCLTRIWVGPRGVARSKFIVESSGIRWIAVQGSDGICAMSNHKMGYDKDKGTLRDFLGSLFEDIDDPYTHDNCLDALKSEDSGTRKSFAVVSVVLGTEGPNKTFDPKVSNARMNGNMAINFLQEKLRRCLTFTIDESIQTGLFALQQMVGGALNLGDIEQFSRVRKILVEQKVNLPREIANLSLMVVLAARKRVKKKWGGAEEENKSRYRCKTTIWFDGFDSRLVESSGFSWIGVLGMESICVVTGDKTDESHLEDALFEMTDHPLFKDDWYDDGWPEDSASVIPFAAVSLVDVGGASVSKDPSARVDGTQAIRFLKDRINNKLDLTYEETIKTAFCALQLLWKDIKDTRAQAYVLTKEEVMKQLPITEIEHWLSMTSPTRERF